jgi:hypothetical protein
VAGCRFFKSHVLAHLAGRCLWWLLRLAWLTVYTAVWLLVFIFGGWVVMVPYYVIRGAVRDGIRSERGR